MAYASTLGADSGATDGLAAERPAAFGRAMSPAAPADPAAARERAKVRLYVLCQAGGWLLFLATQVLFVRLFRPGAEAGSSANSYAALVQTACLGLLITHLARGWISRRGWKDFGWRQLVLRVPALAAALSVIWCASGYAIFYGLLRQPWASQFDPLLIFSVSVVNGTFLMAAWLCLYFFFHLFGRYDRLEMEQLRLAASVKDAELRALKSQVNPHFLFNSLNSLRALIEEDPPRAREAVTRMANMLRYSLQSGAHGTVPFEDELRIVEDYLALEQIRHEKRLRVRWDIAEDVRQRALPVPPMLLQTLVENAVKYGIGPRREGGEIEIMARCEGGALRIRVSNPGELAAPNDPAASTGVGLRNASERLKLLFGDRAALHVQAAPDGHVSAEVFIPLERARA